MAVDYERIVELMKEKWEEAEPIDDEYIRRTLRVRLYQEVDHAILESTFKLFKHLRKKLKDHRYEQSYSTNTVTLLIELSHKLFLFNFLLGYEIGRAVQKDEMSETEELDDLSEIINRLNKEWKLSREKRAHTNQIIKRYVLQPKIVYSYVLEVTKEILRGIYEALEIDGFNYIEFINFDLIINGWAEDMHRFNFVLGFDLGKAFENYETDKNR